MAGCIKPPSYPLIDRSPFSEDQSAQSSAKLSQLNERLINIIFYTVCCICLSDPFLISNRSSRRFVPTKAYYVTYLTNIVGDNNNNNV